MIALQTLELPFGKMLAGASDKGVCLLEFFEKVRTEMQLSKLARVFGQQAQVAQSDTIDTLQVELMEYFEGSRTEFGVPLDIRGTDFQVSAWKALLKIPFGQTRSYQEQADTIGNRNAVRAVANANRNNRISILIPCHRVIGKNGTMTGYGGGVWRKEYLLKLEGNESVGSDTQMPLFGD